MRIVGGSARGRTLHAAPGATTRPTADRVRQSLFDLLGQRMDGLRVLDLYAGTGALALEALSRGAASAVLVEHDAKACAVIERNARELGFPVRLLRDDVSRSLRRLAGERFDLVFADPPYALHAGLPVLEGVAQLLSAEARVVIESGRDEPAPEAAGYALADERRYGDTFVRVYTKAQSG